MAAKLVYSRHFSARDNQVTKQECTSFIKFTTGKIDLPIKADKMQSEAFVPVIWTKVPGVREDANVAAVTALCIDADNLTQLELDILKKHLEGSGHAYLLHFTHGCYEAFTTHEKFKVRVIVPLSEPIPAGEWPDFWQRAHTLFNYVKFDEKCGNLSRMYFAPAVPSYAALEFMYEHDWFVYDVTSPPLDVGRVKQSALPAKTKALQNRPKPLTSTPLPRIAADLQQTARRLQSNMHRKTMGIALQAVLDGHEYATEGDRNETMTRVAYLIACEYVDDDPDKLAQLFARSQDLMAHAHATPPDTLEQIADSIRRAQLDIHEKRAVTFEKQSDRESRVVQRVAGILEANHRYTEAEKEIIRNRLGVTSDQMIDCWILISPTNKELYVSTLNGIQTYLYSPDTFSTVLQDLLPSGITLDRVVGSKNNMRRIPLTLREILPQNGTLLSDVVYDYTSPGYALKGRDLHIPCHRSALEPVYHENADAFLHALFDTEYGTAERWLSFFPDTSDKIAALVLYGEKNTGKTLLASGLSRIWQYGQFVTFETAVSRFNFDLTKMPLIFADERLPNDDQVTKHLREIVTTKLFTVEKKYGSMTRCIGSRRLIIASNSLQKLGDDGQDLSMTDLDALRERMWEVKTSLNALEFLNALSVHQRNDLADFQIAEHTLWIEANRKAKRETGRLAVSGSSSAGRNVILANPQVQQILQVLTAVMDKARSGKADRACMSGYRWGEGAIYISKEGVTTNEIFKNLMGNRRQWTAPGKQLRKVSTRDRTSALFEGAKRHCFTVDTDLFFAYLDEDAVVDVDVYRAMVNGELQGA